MKTGRNSVEVYQRRQKSVLFHLLNTQARVLRAVVCPVC